MKKPARASRMKVFTVQDPVFKTEPLFVLGASYAELLKELERFDVQIGPMDEAIAGTMLTFHKTPWRVVWTKELDAGVLLHEVFHLVTRICDDKGIPIRAHTHLGECADETAAYLYEHFALTALQRAGPTNLSFTRENTELIERA